MKRVNIVTAVLLTLSSTSLVARPQAKHVKGPAIGKVEKATRLRRVANYPIFGFKQSNNSVDAVFLQERRRGHQVVVDGALGIIFGPQIITKPKHVRAQEFVHVGLFAEAREQPEFVSLASDSFRRPLFDAERFQIGVYSGTNCDTRGFFCGSVLRKDEPLSFRRKSSL